ncbi:MAG: hypothetical protein LBT46_11820 [Planctomycetaceae bacterium]|jgi:flagellar biosynthesis/type III secretory pathway M-ring protein FliF/YscJ|nr:hypothetical protein [Planctomycetaceae bacterium]
MLEQAKKFYALLKDLFLSMTLGNRIVAALLLTMLLFSFGYLIVGSIKPSDPGSDVVFLYNHYRFSPNEMRAAEAALRLENKNGHQWIGDQLQVPAKYVAAYTAVLAENNVIEKNGLARQMTAKNLTAWQSAKMMDVQMIASKEKDCADAIKMLGGIADSMVISNKRPDWNHNVWARTQVFSAAVTIETIENKPLDDNTVAAIARIVTSVFGVTDMKEISIVDTKNSRAYNGNGEEQSGSQGVYLRHQRKYQDDFNARIYQFLPPIEGMKVETAVELTTYSNEEYFDVEHRKPTVLVDHSMDYQFHKEGYDRFARPGQVAQFSRPLIDPSANVSAKDMTDEKKNEKETTNALPGRETKRTEIPYIPLRVLASIHIPREHIRATWLQKNKRANELPPEPTPEQLLEEQNVMTQDTKRSVAKILELYRSPKVADPLEIVEVTFYDPIKPDVKIETTWEKIQMFLQHHWQTLSLMGLVLCGLTVLWSLTKPQKPDPIVIYEGLETPLEAIDARLKAKADAEAEAQREADAAVAEQEEQIERQLDSFGSIHSLKDEIAALIAENPEAAAAVVRQWIGNAVLLDKPTA